MVDRTRLTAEEFAATKYELPNGGRWVELIAGHVVALQPPSEMHGIVVMNFSKALAEHLRRADEPGYACFDLGLIVARSPDTVRVPQISYFTNRDRFAETDAMVTETRPALVVEVASTNDRRHQMGTRVRDYLRWGVKRVWIIDPVELLCSVHCLGRPVKRLSAREMLSGDPLPAEFRVSVSDLLAEPQC
jgi:Uma2 family endonuclease